MNAVALRIKKIRSNIGLTQEQMADKINLSVKAWQKIENGITRLDLERLNQIAEILDTSLVDLINADESIYVHQENENNGSIYNKEVTIQQSTSDEERELYKKVIEEKEKYIANLEKTIADKDSTIEFLKGLLKKD
ncbi:helix-turn-helix domain-containing protein [Pararcticibacter amylolyticus]|uniref:Transcriptional regulator n=1 Tax=Pararcticibacter amylolyticus TaxID=2173175 RepID=A0A2U2PI26_9SPHI|nr:helix-turn-helix transcriptional regulator [Pararcticibacter amylolyticus]PWG81041.1 transcriptional regulator [Pararcticibacter amylolyticus]